MKSLRLHCHPQSCLAALLLCAFPLPAVLGQARTEEEAAPSDGPAEANTSRADAERTNLRYPRRVGEIVHVFSASEVRSGQRASSVHSVFGSTRVEGEVDDQCVTVFGDATVNGNVDGECVTVFGDFELNSRVNGDVVVVMGNARFGPKAEVEGECVVVGGRITYDPEAVFHGQVHEIAGFLPVFGTWLKYGLLLGRPVVPSLGWVWLVVLAHVLVYAIVALLAPRPVEMCARMLRDRAPECFGVGLLALFLFWPIVLIVSATGVGLLVIPFLFIAAVAAFILGKTATFQWVGNGLLRRCGWDTSAGAFPAFLLGLVVVTLLYMVWVLGFVLWGVLVPLAFGAVVLAAVQSIREARANRPVPTVPVTGAAALSGSATMDPGSTPASLALPGPSNSGPTSATATAELTALPRAGFWIRLAAASLDFVLLCWFIGVVDGFFPLLWLTYHVGMWIWKGTTIGGIVCGLKVVREDGRPLDFTVSLVRGLAAVFSLVALGIGFFWAGWSPERQSWHDKIAGTTIVRVPRGMSLI